MSFWEAVLKHVLEPANFIEAMFSFGSIILSVIAIVISIVTFRSQKEHNKNSVRPILNIDFGDYNNDLYIRIENCGVGPAKIKSVSCTHIAKNNIVNKDCLPELLVYWMSQQANPVYLAEKLQCFTDFVESINERTISQEHNIVLLRLANPTETQLIVLRSFLKDVTIKVEYTDIYNSKPWICSRKCDFFGRTLSENALEKIMC